MALQNIFLFLSSLFCRCCFCCCLRCCFVLDSLFQSEVNFELNSLENCSFGFLSSPALKISMSLPSLVLSFFLSQHARTHPRSHTLTHTHTHPHQLIRTTTHTLILSFMHAQTLLHIYSHSHSLHYEDFHHPEQDCCSFQFNQRTCLNLIIQMRKYFSAIYQNEID